MFWIELYLIIQISAWFINRMQFHITAGERNALIVLSSLGIKGVLLFLFITLGFQKFVSFPILLTILVYLGYFAWTKIRPLKIGEAFALSIEKKSLSEVSGFWVLVLLFILGLANAWFFPITGADAVWHHVKGMEYGMPLVDFESKKIIHQFRQYPPFIGLLYGWLISSGIVKVTIIFPVLYICLLYIFYYRLYDHVGSSIIAAVATLTVGTTPYLWWHSYLPFLDWTAGVFYVVGVLYWFLLVKKISYPLEKFNKDQNKSLAILSGFFFGLAGWTRPEFLIFSAIPMFLLVCAFDRKNKPIEGRKLTIAYFSMTSLALPSIWFLVILNFNDPLDSIFKQLILTCLALWIGVSLVLITKIRLTYRISIGISIFVLLFYFIGLILVVPVNVSIFTTLIIRLFRLFSVHIFFIGTSLLIIYLFYGRMRQLNVEEKFFGALAAFFISTQFMVYSYSGLKWPTFIHYVNNTFYQPGNSINLSDTRGTIAFYPLLVFFVFCLPKLKQKIENQIVKKYLMAIVAINLTVILIFFAGPRIKFIIQHSNKSYEQISETSGPDDLPNQFSVSYKVANELKNKVDRGLSLVIDMGSNDGLIRSVIAQVLFRHNLLFSNDFGSQQKIKSIKDAYVVTFNDGENGLCTETNSERLGDTGFVLCKVD